MNRLRPLAAAAFITAVINPASAKELVPVTSDPSETVTSVVASMALPGNPNIITAGIPEIPDSLRTRVKQYLNARAASLLDVAPDGDEILISTRFADTAQLHIVEMPMGARQQLTFSEEPVSSGAYLPENREVIYYLQDTGGGEFHQIYRFNRASGTITMITDGKSKHGSLLFSRDGKLMAYLSTARNGKDMDVYVAETADPSSPRRVVEEEGTWFPVDFSPDGDRLLVGQFRSVNDSDLHVVDLADGKRTRLTPESPPASVGAAAFSADGKQVYLVTNRHGDFNELCRLDPANPSAPQERLTRSIPWDVEGLAVARDGSAVAFITNEDGISRLRVLRRGSTTPRLLELPNGVISAIQFASDKPGRIFLALDSPDSPSDVWHMDLNSPKPVRWTKSEVGGLDTSTFIQPKVVRYPSTGGVTVPALYYQPRVPSNTPAKRPVVIIFHGGPEGQSRPNYSSIIQLLARDLGIAVLLPNVRGSDGYGKKFLAMDDGVKREQSLDDIPATLDWIAAQPELDPDRVAVYGGSYGGYMTLAALAFQPDRIRAGVDIVGISNIASFLENTQDYRRDLRRAEYGDERDPAVRAVQDRISPLNSVDKINAALFVQQGKNDPRVPQSEAEQIVNAVRATGKPVWYLLALNEGHGFARKENRDYALTATIQFLKEQLLAQEPVEGP